MLRLADIRADSMAAITVAYDALGRATSAARKQPLQPTFKNETASYSYDAAGQIVGCSYDGLGRLLSDGTRSYEWDVASHLKTVTASSAADPLRFEYDGLGRVTRRTLGAEVEDEVQVGRWGKGFGFIEAGGDEAFAHGRIHGELHLRWQGSVPSPGDLLEDFIIHVAPDHNAEVHPIWSLGIHVKDDPFLLPDRPIRSSSPIVDYVYTPAGELLHSVDDASGSRRFYHFDDRGNTIFLTNDAGSVVTSYAYSVSGSSVDELGLGTSHLGRYTYRGQLGALEESGIGLLYRGAPGIVYDGRTNRLVSPPPGPHGDCVNGSCRQTIAIDIDIKKAHPTWVYIGSVKSGRSGLGPRLDGPVILTSSLPGGVHASPDVWATFARNWGNEGNGMQLYFTGKLKSWGAGGYSFWITAVDASPAIWTGHLAELRDQPGVTFGRIYAGAHIRTATWSSAGAGWNPTPLLFNPVDPVGAKRSHARWLELYIPP